MKSIINNLYRNILVLFFLFLRKYINIKFRNKQVVAIYDPTSIRQFKVALAFAFGANCKIISIKEYKYDSDFAMFPSLAMLHLIESTVYNYYYIDKAYFGRGNYYRITKNSSQYNGIRQSNGIRFKELKIDRKLQRSEPKYIYICPQSHSFMASNGIDKENWINHIIKEIRIHSNYEPIIHEKSSTNTETTFKNILVNAKAVVVYSSIAGVQAMMYGIPCIALDKGSSAATIAPNYIDGIDNLKINNVDVELLLHTLADNQWSLFEIFMGIAWKKLMSV